MSASSSNTYEARFDPVVSTRITRALNFAFWGRWISAASLWMTLGALCAVTGYFCGSLSEGGDFPEGVTSAIGGGAIAGLILMFVSGAQTWFAHRDYQGETWQCVITDEAWSYRNRAGVMVEIPWDTMSVRFTHEDAWLIQFQGQRVWVYRRPLREAGLEELFFSHLPNRSGKL